MLAYVFSHRPESGADVQAYEDALRRFHSELAGGRPVGFVSSTTYRFEDGYSDWYLVEDSAALDFLNEAAVSGARATSHDAAAGMAAWGSGKLLSLAQGEADLDALHEIAFAKPAGTAYRGVHRQSGRGVMAADDGAGSAAGVLPGRAISSTSSRPIHARAANAPPDLTTRALHH